MQIKCRSICLSPAPRRTRSGWCGWPPSFSTSATRRARVNSPSRPCGTRPTTRISEAGPLRHFLKGVPQWHFAIVRDAARNAAYEEALKRVVTPQTRVLEIGTGSGILAMMAARAGARYVITCEMVPAVAEAAQEIVALNGLSERVRVVAKKSHDLDAERDIGGRADVLVSEIVDNKLLGEGV